jgi:hypothetical protein
MSLRKLAGLAAGFALAAGLVGAGVGANFTASVTAQENIHVGTFGCIISAATPGAVIAGNGSWVTYQAPDILLSTPGSAPFSFTVKANGTIAAKLHVASAVTGGAAFSSMLVNPVGDVVLNAGDTQAFTAGLKWTELWNPDLNTTASVTYTVSCTDATTFTTFGPATVTNNAGTYTIVSTSGTPEQCAPYAAGCTTWGGIDLTGKNSGKLIGNVNFSFTSSGQSGGGAPRFSLPISTDGTSTIAFYAFLDPVSCGAAPNATFTVSTSVATCVVWTNLPIGGGPYANWAAFVAAHSTWEIAPGAIPFIVADGATGTFIVSGISE